MSELIRRSVVYVGRVQGVGFRATCHELARGGPIVGYVRNCRDGTVELEAEGEPADVDAFLHAIATHMAAFIRSAQTTDAPPLRTETGFDIRY